MNELEDLDERLDELEKQIRLTAKQKYNLMMYTVWVVGFVAIIYFINH